MQLVRRPLAPGEVDHEFIWLVVSLGSIAGALSWVALKLPWPVCFFHAVTGYPCVTCGVTRAGIAFFHGQFLAAWKWNPLAFIGYCALLLFNFYALWAVSARQHRWRLVQLTRGEKQVARILLVALLGANWIYLLLANPSI